MEELRPSSGVSPSESALNPNPLDTTVQNFGIGTAVIYGLHGRCQITAIETRKVGSETQAFYKVEVQRSTLSRSKKPEPAIWVPVQTAMSRGLRAPMNGQTATEALAILQNREYYFSSQEPWSQVFPKIESMLRLEGGIGLAKVYSYLYVLKNRHLVPPSEIMKHFDATHRQLFKELSEALNETPREIELKIAKGLRSKLAADQ